MTTPENMRPVSLKWQTVLRVVLAGALLIGLTHFPLPVSAAPASNTWYVATTGSDTNSCTSSDTACRTINAAINRAASGDTINIAAGTYVENINLSKSLSLVGAGQTVTIIDGDGIGPVVLITSEGAATIANLSGLTLQNGANGLGGGLHSESGPAGLVTVSNSRITSNTAFAGGGGIFSQGNLKLVDVLIENNVNNGAQRGGGLFNLGTATLTGVSILNNSSNLGGGIGNTGALTLTASTVASNHADAGGGGIYNAGSGAQFISSNNTYVGNHTNGAGGAIFNAQIAVDTGSLITGSLAATSGGGIYNFSTGQLTLALTTLGNNQATNTHGGGLYNDGHATLTGVTVRGNAATTGIGGGLYTAGINGAMSIADTVVSDNRAVNGGGLYAAGLNGALTVINSQFTNNQSDLSGGGLYSNMTANLSSVTVANNRAISGKGGGIYAGAASQLALTSVTLNNNLALGGDGGGLYNEATASATGSTLTRNQAANGGGLYNNSNGRLSVNNSTWYQNSATQGGGINNHGTLTLTQSTLYSNTTTLQGGSGLYNNATAQLTNVTLSYNAVLSATTGAILNDGGALAVLNSTISHNRWPALAHTGGSIALANTIVAASTGGNNCSGALISNGHNLDSGNSCGLSATGDISNTDPLLGPLTNNGGPTFTRGLEVDSRAIDAGSNAVCPPLDQRGIARPQGDRCDIGAYETIGYTNNVTETIAAGHCVTSTTVVTNSYLIGSLHVGVNATFTPRGDLRVKLYSPDHRTVQLLGATGGSGQGLDVLWDDDSPFGPVGSENEDTAAPYYNYVRVPDQSLIPLFGRSLYGSWKLEVCNLSSNGSNIATLNRWSLLVPSVGAPKVYLPLVARKH